MGKQERYGLWKSPISASDVSQISTTISEVIVDTRTSKVYYLESRPSEKGRVVIIDAESKENLLGEGTEWNARDGVHEYGGAPALVHDDILYFSHFADGRVYMKDLKQTPPQDPQPITPESKIHRFANFAAHPTQGHLLVCVLEDHTHDRPSTVVNTLAIINTSTKSVSPLLSGADFYAAPSFSQDGKKLAWQQWTHPDMPWFGAEIFVADAVVSTDSISLKAPVHVAGKHTEISAAYPSWGPDEVLFYTTDETGYQNLYKINFRAGSRSTLLLSQPLSVDFGEPNHKLGWSPYAVSKDGGSVIAAGTEEGRETLYQIDVAKGSFNKLPSDYVAISNVRLVSGENFKVAFVGVKVDEPTAVVTLSLSKDAQANFQVLKPGSSLGYPSSLFSRPQHITVSGARKSKFGTDHVHVLYSPPTNPEYTGSPDPNEKPPCVVHVHGGPTSLSSQGFSLIKQFFTTRGWAWLDVNHRGSSGYGRKYIDSLNGEWGILDGEDCIFAVNTLSQAPHSLIDPRRTVIRGGSAGGYTTLCAVTITSNVNTFAAAASSFGISDLKKLEDDTHKFEAGFLEHLIGGTYKTIPETFDQRSPVNYAERIVSPLLILQGDIDRVVPKEQSEAIVEKVKQQGGVVEYELFAGEGHGWRQQDTIKAALEKELAFYERVLKLA